MTESTPTTASNPLAIPALVVGLIAVALTPVFRAPVMVFPLILVAIAAIVLGHLALPKSFGRNRWVALGGLVAGYVAIVINAATLVSFALR